MTRRCYKQTFIATLILICCFHHLWMMLRNDGHSRQTQLVPPV
jgi:hypothetical protein